MSTRNSTNGQRNSTMADSKSSRGYQDFDGDSAQGSYQNFNTPEFRDQKETFFNRIQEENASRPEWVDRFCVHFYALDLNIDD